MDRCFNDRHRPSNPVSARKTLTIAPPKFVQRLITAWAKLSKQRRPRVQDFWFGLADKSVHELASSGAKLWLSVVRPVVNFAGQKHSSSSPGELAIFCAAQNVRSGRRDHKRWSSVYGVSLTVANVCWMVTSGDDSFHRSRNAPVKFVRWDRGFSSCAVFYIKATKNCILQFLSCYMLYIGYSAILHNTGGLSIRKQPQWRQGIFGLGLKNFVLIK